MGHIECYAKCWFDSIVASTSFWLLNALLKETCTESESESRGFTVLVLVHYISWSCHLLAKLGRQKVWFHEMTMSCGGIKKMLPPQVLDRVFNSIPSWSSMWLNQRPFWSKIWITCFFFQGFPTHPSWQNSGNFSGAPVGSAQRVSREAPLAPLGTTSSRLAWKLRSDWVACSTPGVAWSLRPPLKKGRFFGGSKIIWWRHSA